MTIYLLRGSHANEYELQNYYPLTKSLDIQLISSHTFLTPVKLPTYRLWPPADLPHFPFRSQIFNRIIGGEQWLLGLEQLVKPTDILHTAETYTPYTHQAVQLRKHGRIKKLICTCWETIPHNNEKFSRFKLWKQAAYQYVDIFHTPTHRAANALIKEGVDKDKIKVIPYGVDINIFYPPKRKVKNKKPLILTVARRVPEKGLVLWEQVQKSLGDRAVFRWVDSVPYHDMPAVYQSANLFFFPSLATSTWEEQYGVALVEAMATGLPIIASRSGAIPEVISRVGILINPSNVDQVIKTLKKLINNHHLRYKLSQKSQHFFKTKYSLNKITNLLSTLY